MSDLEDRGAYTPFSRDQLAFDPRDMRRRRPVPLTLMASAVVLVALAGAALMFYQSGVRGRNEPPRAIGTKVASIKTAPPAAGASADPNAAPAGSLDVYVQDRPEPGAAQPVYTPAPEQPAPRQAAAQPAVQASSPIASRPTPQPAVKSAPTYPSIEAAADAAETAPAPTPVKKAAAPKLAAATPAVKPKPDAKAAAPIKAAAAKATDTDKAAAGGSQAVQIGAYSSKALADQEFAKVRAGFAKFTSGRGVHVEAVQKGSATLYRAAFTGFSKTQATAFCGALKAAGRACIVK